MDTLRPLNKLLKQITTSKNYEIEKSCGYRLYYTGKNIPIGCKREGKEQICYDSDINSFAHKLICMAKYRKLTTISTKDYIDRMNYLFEQCTSHITYGYNFEGSSYIEDINLPYDLKKDVYNYVKTSMAFITSNVYTDSEGCTYNSFELTKVI